MKMMATYKVVFLVAMAGLMSLGTSCAPDQLFNASFLADTGLQVGTADRQVAPDLPQFLVLKAVNQTTYPAKIMVTIKRAQVDEGLEVVLAPTQTVGKLVENCNSANNPVLSLFVPLLNAGSDSTNQVPIPIGQVFVTVDGLPVLIPASELPGALNVRQHFNCGDTVEFVIHTSFTDTNRYQVSAVVYRGDLQP